MPKMTATPVPTIVVTIDGLRAAALGAYGQTSYETPAFDALAAESRTFDEVYAPTPQAAELFTRLAPTVRALDAASLLVTDDPATTAEFGGVFDRVVKLSPPVPDEPSTTIEATAAAETWAAFAEALVEFNQQRDAERPWIVWLHTRGLYGPWDAPIELMASLIDEEDPEVEAGATPPNISLRDDDADPVDARFAASCRYAAQVMTLDACLGGWLDIVEGLFEGEDYRLVVSGIRGFPLGEHGQVGGVDTGLFTEQQHCPLLACQPGPDGRFERSATPRLLDAALVEALTGERATGDAIVMLSAAAQAVMTRDWFVRRTLGDPEAVEMYVKPDDRWDQNDIASRREEVAAALLALLPIAAAEPRDSGVAAPGDGA